MAITRCHLLRASSSDRAQRSVLLQLRGIYRYWQKEESSFSFRSNHSHKSSTGSGHKLDLHETHQEKERKRLTTKANPSMALTEAEPCAYILYIPERDLGGSQRKRLISTYSCDRKWSSNIIGFNQSNSTSRHSRKPNWYAILVTDPILQMHR